MAFPKLLAFTKKVADLDDKPSLTPSALKAQFDAAPDELRQTYNTLIDGLKSTASGDSGAKNLGATTISGLTGNDVQTLLESLKSYIDTTDTNRKTYVDGLSYLPAGLGKNYAGQSGTLNLPPGASQDFIITFPSGRFSSNPSLVYSIYNTDVDGQYNVASSIVSISSSGATIRVKNKGNSYQYVIVYFQAQEQK